MWPIRPSDWFGLNKRLLNVLPRVVAAIEPMQDVAARHVVGIEQDGAIGKLKLQRFWFDARR